MAAIINGKYRVKNSQNDYDIVHLETSANQVKFDDGKTFQQKLNEGTLKGDKGDTGAKGQDGLTTSVTVGSVKYTHINGNINLPDYPSKISQLSNDSKFITINDVHTHTNKEILDNITQDKINYWNNKSDFSGAYKDLTGLPEIPKVDVNKAYVDDKIKEEISNKVVHWDDIVGKPAEFNPISHNHNDIYYQKNEVDTIVEPIDDTFIDNLFTSPAMRINGVKYYTADEIDTKINKLISMIEKLSK